MADQLITKGEAFKILALDALKPSHQTIIEPIAVEWFGLAFIRVKVSELNRRNKMNLRVHKYPTGQVGVWHDPNPIPPKFKGVGLFDQLLQVKRQHAELRKKHDVTQGHERNLMVNQLIELNEKAEEIVKEMKRQSEDKTRKNSGGRISQPLEVVLKHIGVTEAEWGLLPGYEQTRRWIKAELEIKEMQRELGE